MTADRVGTHPRTGLRRGYACAGSVLAYLVRLRRAPLFWPAIAGAVAFTVSALVLVWAGQARPTLKLQLAFSENACCSLQVWVNGTTLDDITVLNIQPGRTAVYSVPVWKARVVRLRMPLGEVPDSSVTVKRVWIARGARVVSEVDAAQLSRAAVYDARKRVAPAGVEIEAEGRRPFLDLPVALETSEHPARLYLARLLAQPLEPLVALLVLGVLITVVFSLASRQQAALLAAVGLTLLAVRALPSLLGRLTFHDDVSQSVSYSSYQGVPKSRERLIAEVAVVLALVVPAVVALLVRRRLGAEPAPAARAHAPLSRAARVLLVAVPATIVALAAMPDLRALIGAGRSVQYVPSWDANNLTFWHYLIQLKDLAPMKDFFWPYGFQWLFDLAVPWGDLWSYLVYLTFWSYLAIGTYVALARFFSGRALAGRVVFVAGFWLTVFLAGLAPFTTRYIAPVAVVLLYSGLESRDRLLSWKRIVFAIALFELALFEVTQLVYALVPIAFLLGVELVADVRKRRAEVLAWLGRAAATIALPVAAASVVYALTDELAGTFDYYSRLGALTAAYAWPGPIVHWIADPDDLASFVFWAMPISISLGVYGLLIRRDRPRFAYAVVVALGLLAAIVMQKQVLRPPIETQIWPAVVFGLVFWAAVDTSLHRVRRWAAVGLFTGVAVALILVAGGYRRGWEKVADGPPRLARSIGALAHDRHEFAADARAQFAPARFANFTQYKPVVAALRRDPAIGNGGQVWILGDDSPIVMMLGQSWPYYFNDLYDAAPIAFQQKVIERLESNPPARVVWNFSPDALIFDTVPQPVRSPLLYQWTIQHYVPLREAGEMAILRRRREGEPVPLAWWRDRLGASLDLGHIPEVASDGAGECSSGADCGTYAVVELGEDTERPARMRIQLDVGGLQFAVEFATSSSSRYVVPLDRVWFWAAVPARAREVEATEPGITVVRRRRESGVLY